MARAPPPTSTSPQDTFALYLAASRRRSAAAKPRPPWLKFEVLTPAPIEMRPGTLIDCRIRVHGFPIRWRTEITAWDTPHRFADVQLLEPYTLGHHTHTFAERDGGTLCLYHVRDRPRGGALIHWLFVRRDVERIFQYRQQRMQKLFGTKADETVHPASNR